LMTRALALLLGLLFVTVPAASQQVPNPMSNDAANAKLPDARNNLELGTVKSEGGTPPNPDNTTRFYTYGGAGGTTIYGKQFEIGSRPNANEYAIEYAGLSAPGGVGVGQGATRLCWAPYSNNQVNCNYVAFGRLGQHRFANGAGFQAEMLTQGVGSVTGWPQFIASDDAIARIWAGGSADSGLELRANGNGAINFFNDIGGKLVTIDNGQGVVNDRYIRLIGGTVASEPRVQGYSDAAPDVTLRVMGKGTGGITFENDHGILGRFDSAGAGATRVWLRFIGGDGTLAVIGSESPNFSDVPIYMVAQGKGNVIIANQDDVDGGNNMANFISGGAGSYTFNFTQQSPTVAGNIGSSGGAFNMYGFRHPMIPQTTSNITVTIPDTGKHYNNIGSTVTNNFILPQTTANSSGVHYCFHRDAAQVLRITANATDQIAFGATNSALGGTLTATGAAANFASVCLETHRQGQWIVTSTADKTQWTIP
jgi:hypothetical protein